MAHEGKSIDWTALLNKPLPAARVAELFGCYEVPPLSILARLLTDSDAAVRKSAVDVCSNVSEEDSEYSKVIELLTPLLVDPCNEVAAAAATVFQSIPLAGRIHDLCTFLDQKPWWRLAIGEADVLTEGVNAVVAAVEASAEPPHFLQRLAQYSDWRERGAFALAAFRLVEENLMALDQALSQVIGMSQADPDERVRFCVVLGLGGWVGGNRGFAGLGPLTEEQKTQIQQVLKTLAEEDMCPMVRSAAVAALTNTLDKDQAAACLRVFCSDPDIGVAWTAMDSMVWADITEDERHHFFNDLAQREDTPYDMELLVEQLPAAVLGDYVDIAGSASWAWAMVKLKMGLTRTKVRTLEDLGYRRDPGLAEVFRRRWTNSSIEVRAQALGASGMLRDPAAFKPLTEFAKTPSGGHGDPVANGLCQYMNRQALDALLYAVQSSKAEDDALTYLLSAQDLVASVELPHVVDWIHQAARPYETPFFRHGILALLFYSRYFLPAEQVFTFLREDRLPSVRHMAAMIVAHCLVSDGPPDARGYLPPPTAELRQTCRVKLQEALENVGDRWARAGIRDALLVRLA